MPSIKISNMEKLVKDQITADVSVPAVVGGHNYRIEFIDLSSAVGDGKLNVDFSNIEDAAGARAALELGDSATLNVGTTAGTVMAGDDSRIATALQSDDI